jgi:FkbH-like protein
VLKNFSNEIEFLESLEMHSEVSLIGKFTIPRVAQLSQRSNQFNLRTIRYTEEDIFEISISNDFIPISFTLKDKFGDYGLIASVILKKLNQNSVFIDTWIMSCRVLKRGMENFTLNYICLLAIEKGFTTIIGEYIPTKKNEIVRNHYQELGFVFENEKWNLDLLNFKPTKNYINK